MINKKFVHLSGLSNISGKIGDDTNRKIQVMLTMSSEDC